MKSNKDTHVRVTRIQTSMATTGSTSKWENYCGMVIKTRCMKDPLETKNVDREEMTCRKLKIK